MSSLVDPASAIWTPRSRDSNVIWTPTEKQAFALSRPEREILFGGSRGGGKSDCGRAFILRYADNPNFRCLVIRLQAEDLKEWCDKAERMFSRFGAKMTGRPPVFKFPSGATIWTGHLQDRDAYMKYQGWELNLIVIEELTQIPREEDYEKLLGSLRSSDPNLPTQVFCTTNPGGPGTEWVRSRFLTCVDFKGRPAEPMRPTILDKKGRNSRIYIPATIDDNPYLADADPGYIEYLDSLPEALRQAWRFGDWDAFKGQFFSEFRQQPKAGEPPEARHVIPSVALPKWCPKWIGWDWGYSHDTAVYWGCQTEDQRVHVYREIHENTKNATRRYGAEEMGAMVAEASLEDLEGLPDHHLTIYLSPDAYQRRDARNTIAQQIEVGMRLVLGSDAVFLVDYNEDERAMSIEDALKSLERRREAQKGKIAITIERANTDRKAGWMYIRKLLRWWPIKTASGRQPDEKVVRAILRMPDATRRYAEYMSQFETQQEVLPLLQIHDCCTSLPKGILAARHSESDPEDVLKEDGDDRADALRYLLMGHRKQQVELPKGEFVSRLMSQRTATYGNLSMQSRVMMARTAERQFEAQQNSASAMVYARRRPPFKPDRLIDI